MSGQEFTRRSVAAAGLSGLGMMFSTGPIVFATFSLFMLPLASEFGWGRGEISLALVISSGCAALSDPIVGRLVDRWGVRRVLLPGMLLFAFANAALSTLTGALAQLYAYSVLLGIGSAMCAGVPYSKVIAGWFHERRGLVLGVALGIGAGAGSAIMPQIARPLIEEYGWREARLLLSGLLIFFAFPIMLFFLRESPAAAAGSGARAAMPGVAAAEAIRTRLFQVIFAMIFVGTMVLAGTVVHLIAMLADHGLTVAVATSFYSAYAVSNVAGHALIGYLQDRFQSPRVGLPVYGAALAGILLLAFSESTPLLLLGAVCLGLGFGAEVSLGAYWVARYWGLKAYGEVYGFLYCAASAGAAIGPFLMGTIFDLTGSYDPVLIAFAGVILVCICINLLLGPYVYPARMTAAEPVIPPDDAAEVPVRAAATPASPLPSR
ncbi:MFS transporter [Allosphingosinicella humi]